MPSGRNRAPVGGAEPLAAVGLTEEVGGGELGITPVAASEVAPAEHHDPAGVAVGDGLVIVVDDSHLAR